MNRHDGACVISSDRYVMQGCLQLHATINKDKTLYMSRKKKPLPVLENVTITDYAAEGKSIARVNDLVVFVPFAVPGDVVDLQVRRKKHSYCEAEIIRIVKPSDVRIAPQCAHFGLCGGCKWQNVPYAEQLKMKQKQVHDQLTRIGKVELPEIRPILGSEKTFGYRNKLEFGCCNKRWLTKEEISAGTEYTQMNAIGFHITGAFDKILPIENSDTGEWMVLVQFHYDEEGDGERAKGLLQHIADSFPEITSLLYVDNQKANDTYNDLDIQVFKGEDHIFETMEELKFKVGAKSFYQTNTEQALRLYSVVRDFAGLTGNELVYDLYTGTGTIANFVARNARKVVGIEYVPEAIEDAKVNSEINGIVNTLFYAGDMKDILTDDFIAANGRPDIVITDPPRAGMHPDVVQTIIRTGTERIVYVSCNPATQARDLALLDQYYKVEAVQPVDMFPHTPHVENVVLLVKRS